MEIVFWKAIGQCCSKFKCLYPKFKRLCPASPYPRAYPTEIGTKIPGNIHTEVFLAAPSIQGETGKPQGSITGGLANKSKVVHTMELNTVVFLKNEVNP